MPQYTYYVNCWLNVLGKKQVFELMLLLTLYVYNKICKFNELLNIPSFYAKTNHA